MDSDCGDRRVGKTDLAAIAPGRRPDCENPRRRFVEWFDPPLEHPFHGFIDAFFELSAPRARRQQRRAESEFHDHDHRQPE